MRRVLAMLFVSFTALSTLPGKAVEINVLPSPGYSNAPGSSVAGVSGNASVGSVATGTGGAVDNIAALVPTSQGEVDAIAAVKGPVKVRVVTLKLGIENEALTKARDQHKEDVARLRRAIDGNAELRAALEAAGIKPEAVIAADVTAERDLTLYAGI